MRLEAPRLRSFEGVNCRHEDEVAALPLHATYDLVVMDLSFISLELVLPVAWRRCGGDLVCLVKPQFECGKDVVAKGRGAGPGLQPVCGRNAGLGRSQRNSDLQADAS